MKTKVVLARCDSYDREKVKDSITKVIDALGGFNAIFAEREVCGVTLPAINGDSQIVLKPNLLAKAAPEKAVTTHPEVFRAVGELLQERGYSKITYGDSPGNPILSVEKTVEGCGIKTVADELRIKVGDFSSGRTVTFPQARASKSFVLCNEIADNPYGVINLCKMKTHQLERVTGATKNTFGCVYGVNKAAFHARFATPETFARVIADLNRLVIPRLHIMDGIVAMEGNGPGSGDPVQMNVLLASLDPVALDATFCHLIDLNADLVPTQKACIEAGVGEGREEEISVIAIDVPMIPDGKELTLDEVAVKCGNKYFSVQRSKDYRGRFRVLAPFAKLLEKKPHIVKERCVGCGICVRTCPLEEKAILMGEDRKPFYDHSKCIKCYCCQEMCPERAISVKKSVIARISDRRWGV